MGLGEVSPALTRSPRRRPGCRASAGAHPHPGQLSKHSPTIAARPRAFLSGILPGTHAPGCLARTLRIAMAMDLGGGRVGAPPSVHPQKTWRWRCRAAPWLVAGRRPGIALGGCGRAVCAFFRPGAILGSFLRRTSLRRDGGTHCKQAGARWRAELLRPDWLLSEVGAPLDGICAHHAAGHFTNHARIRNGYRSGTRSHTV
jgi:hypothetical protein